MENAVITSHKGWGPDREKGTGGGEAVRKGTRGCGHGAQEAPAAGSGGTAAHAGYGVVETNNLSGKTGCRACRGFYHSPPPSCFYCPSLLPSLPSPPLPSILLPLPHLLVCVDVCEAQGGTGCEGQSRRQPPRLVAADQQLAKVVAKHAHLRDQAVSWLGWLGLVG